jgi:EmrB/QacA subfamily drug resistance transporter
LSGRFVNLFLFKDLDRTTSDLESAVHQKKYRFLLVSALSAFLGTLDASIVNVSLPTLSRTFNVPIDIVAWVVLAYALAVTSTLLVVGRLAVKNGYRFVYMIGFALFTVGSALCALSGSIWQLIAFRVIQGVGASFLMASGPALVTRAFPAGERGKSLGLLGTVVGIGLMSGPPLGGFLVSTVGWHSIFLINIPVGIFGFFYVNQLLKIIEPDHPEARINYISGYLQATGVVCLLLFFNRLNTPEWPNEVIYGFLIISLVSLTVFLWREARGKNTLIGLTIFKHKQFTIAISVMVISFTCTASWLVLIPFYLETILGLQPNQVGMVLMTIPVCTALVAPLSGRVSDAIGYRFLTTMGLTIVIAGTLWISTLDQNANRLDVVMRLIVVGIGAGMFQSPNSSAMMSGVPKNILGVASSLLGLGRNIAITGGVAVSTAIFVYRKSIYLKTMEADMAFIKSFSWVAIAFACLAILGAVLSSLRMNRPAKN